MNYDIAQIGAVMAVTMHDVARLAGVSIKTVSNVINDYPHIRPSTRERVVEAIKHLEYQPNASARSLRSGRSRMIGLALPELSLSYFAELADNVMRAAERRDLVVLIEQTNGDREKELAVLSGPQLPMIDGLLFSPQDMGEEDMSALTTNIPLVLLGERIFGAPVDHVTMQNVAGARAATRHLISLGRRRIAVIGAPDDHEISTSGLRLRGYREALADAGIPYDDALRLRATPWHREQGSLAIRELVATRVEFDAVFAFNDTLALGAMHALQVAGLRIPDDVAVIGWDALDDAKYSIPTLTTLDPGREKIAELAVDLLVERIEHRGEPFSPEEIEVDFSIIERESTPEAVQAVA
jgi:DNA-binding LacI/PurR family transcriptional regulator